MLQRNKNPQSQSGKPHMKTPSTPDFGFSGRFYPQFSMVDINAIGVVHTLAVSVKRQRHSGQFAT